MRRVDVPTTCTVCGANLHDGATGTCGRACDKVVRIRARLKALTEPCYPGCKGWAVIDSGLRGLELQRCDDCWSGQPNALRDDDIECLPEAQEELKRMLASNVCEPQGKRRS